MAGEQEREEVRRHLRGGQSQGHMHPGGPAAPARVKNSNIPWVKDSKILRLQNPLILRFQGTDSMFL